MATNTGSGPGPVRGRLAWARLSERPRAAHRRALDALSLMRTQDLSLTAAAAAAGTTPGTVRRYGAPALTRAHGRYVAAPADRLYRRMSVLTPTGRVEIDVRGSRAASKVAAHWNAVHAYLQTGDTRALAAFTGVRVGGVALLTDPPAIEASLGSGELDIDDIYPHR